MNASSEKTGKGNQAKRHHYLPESYLRRFTHGGEKKSVFWVFDIQQRNLRPQTPHNTTLEKYYYAVEKEDGTKDTSLETLFSSLEGAASKVIDKIEKRDGLSDEERSTLALFLALQTHRVPEFESDTNKIAAHVIQKTMRLALSKQNAQSSIDEYERETGQPLGLTAAEASEFIQSDRYTINIKREFSLHMMMKIVPTVAEDYNRMDWAFYHADHKSSFITTDAPLHITPPPNYEKFPKWAGYGYRHLGTKKIIPLSAKVAIVMFDPGERMEHRDADQRVTREINECLASSAFRFVIGRDEALVKSLTDLMQAAEKRGLKWGGGKASIS